MRLDVGIGGDGKVAWRSLAQRAVTYRFQNDSRANETDRLIQTLLGKPGTDPRRRIDEAVLTTATRLMPVTGQDDQRGHEAIVEQALGTWDGAPMAVFCGRDEATDGSNAVSLPFSVTLDLATARSDPKLRLPPLRYGQTYRIAARAVFPGGGSADVQEVEAAFSRANAVATLPRRFLRHEPVGAPTILLPAAIDLGRRRSAMDFERHTAAILRSAVAADNGPDEDEALLPTLNGRQYVPLAQRLSGSETLRVIVPPRTSLSELLRVGKLDAPATRATVLGGGLCHVAFGHAPGSAPDTPVEAARKASFPMACVTSREGFDSIRFDMERSLAWPDPAGNTCGMQGTSIFAGSNVVNHVHGAYHPDPAAQHLVLRLRHAGTDKPAGRAVGIAVFPDGYPYARPVVLQVIRRDQARQSLPDENLDLIGIPTRTTFDGIRFGRGRQVVWRVPVELFQGDDFDLDLFFRPDKETLAGSFAVIETIGALARSCQTGTSDSDGVCSRIAGVLGQLIAGDTGDGACRTTGGFPVPCNLDALAGRIIERMDRSAAVPEIAAVEIMRLAHAVNRPLAPAVLPLAERIAVFRPAPAAPGDTSPFPLVQAVELASKKRSKDYLLSGDITFHGTTTGAIEIEAETVSPRNPLFDDPARQRTLRARIAGTWPQRSDTGGDARIRDVYGFDVDPVTGKVCLPIARVRLLRIDSVASPALFAPAGTAVTIPLAVAHQAAREGRTVTDEGLHLLFRAAQLHAFPDGKARRLRLRPVAVSRFATDFTTAPFWDDAGSPSRVLLRQELQGPDMRRIGDSVEVWLPASERPAKCLAERPVPTIVLRESVTDLPTGEVETTVHRHMKTRILLKRGWFSSGEGERLGIVIWPPNLFDGDGAGVQDNVVQLGQPARKIDITAMRDQDMGLGGAFVTRWGGDPIRYDRTPQTATLMPGSAFLDATLDSEARRRNPHDPRVVPNVIVPIRIPDPSKASVDKTDENAAFYPFRASLLTYEPCFDIDREEWFVDVDIALGRATDPFVRFGLVRYQENAIAEDLKVSEPIALWTQLLPDREAKARVADKGAGTILVNLDVSGQASAGIKELQPSAATLEELGGKSGGAIEAALSRLRSPSMEMALVHEGETGALLHRTPVWPGGAFEVRGGVDSNGVSSWRFPELKIARERLEELGAGTVYAYVRECEERMPASYATEPVAEAEMFNTSTFAKSGPRFAARIALWTSPGVKPAASSASPGTEERT